jgi:hypothetical protein
MFGALHVSMTGFRFNWSPKADAYGAACLRR